MPPLEPPPRAYSAAADRRGFAPALTHLKPPVPPPSPACPQFDQVLGRGAFKVVYKAFDTQEGASRGARGAGSAGQPAPPLHGFRQTVACVNKPLAGANTAPTRLPWPPLAPTMRAGTEVAWNQVRVSEVMSAKDAENKEERDRLFAEIRVLKALKHKNIMSFYDSWYDPKTYTVNFITELFTSGTLRQ